MDSTILAAVDGSPPALRALKEAASLAERTGRHLRLVTVVSQLPQALLRPTRSWMVDPDLVVQAERQQEQAAAQLLETAADQAGLIPEKVERVVRRGAAAEVIVALAGEPDVSMVVVGTRGEHGAALRALLGSVADRVTHLSPKPVLLVP